MACSRIEPLLEIVEDGRSALVVPPDDTGALAEAVARLAGVAQLRRRLGRALRQVAEERFSARRMAQDYEVVYRAVLAQGRR